MAFFSVFNQVLIMFMLMGVGFLCGKVKFIHETTTKDMTNVLCYIVSPCIIIMAFQQKFTSKRATALLISFLCVIGIFILAISTSKIIFNKKIIKEDGHRNALQFGSVYSNAGFIGIPLLSALLGPEGVFYGTPYMACFNIFCWTHGVTIYNGKTTKKDVLKAFINPNIIAIVVGLIFFLFSVKIPVILSNGLSYVNALNTPLSMIIIGESIAHIKFSEILTDKWIWPGIIMRNLVVPAVSLLILKAVGIDKLIMLSSIIMSACPVAGYTVLFAKIKNADTAFPTKFMTISTLISILTIPLVVYLASVFLY